MAAAGEGYKIYVTGMTHDKRGYPLDECGRPEDAVTRTVREDPPG